MTDKIRIATRASPLAIEQAKIVRECLVSTNPSLASPDRIEILPMRTTGDKIQSGSLSLLGGKGQFTKEIEEALLEDRADIAVHSMKDVPTTLPKGLEIRAFLTREDPRDALIAHDTSIQSLAELPFGAKVGTASLRRGAMLLNLRPDIQIEVLRGSVETRLGKVEAGEVDATFLAVAGLKRLGFLDRATVILQPEEMLPAVCQGTIGVECRKDIKAICDLLSKINHAETNSRTLAERAFLTALDGSCRTPIGGLAEINGPTLSFRGLIVRPDGTEVYSKQHDGNIENAVDIGASVAEDLKARAGIGFFDEDR